jgi:DNA-binding transcriptional ArsR family regulator
MSTSLNNSVGAATNNSADIFELHADLCKTLANSKRLKILALLGRREMSVGELAEVIGSPLSNMSQHLTVLKAQEVVQTRRDGQTIYCRLSDRRILKACTLIRSVLLDRMRAHGQIAQEVDPRYVLTELPE